MKPSCEAQDVEAQDDRACAGELHLLDEDLTQPRLAARVVLEVELVEAVEDVFVRVHVQRVHVQVVPAFHAAVKASATSQKRKRRREGCQRMLRALVSGLERSPASELDQVRDHGSIRVRSASR